MAHRKLQPACTLVLILYEVVSQRNVQPRSGYGSPNLSSDLCELCFPAYVYFPWSIILVAAESVGVAYSPGVQTIICLFKPIFCVFCTDRDQYEGSLCSILSGVNGSINWACQPPCGSWGSGIIADLCRL